MWGKPLHGPRGFPLPSPPVPSNLPAALLKPPSPASTSTPFKDQEEGPLERWGHFPLELPQTPKSMPHRALSAQHVSSPPPHKAHSMWDFHTPEGSVTSCRELQCALAVGSTGRPACGLPGRPWVADGSAALDAGILPRRAAEMDWAGLSAFCPFRDVFYLCRQGFLASNLWHVGSGHTPVFTGPQRHSA